MCRAFKARRQITVATDRCAQRAGVALVVVVALSAGIFGFGHHHSGDDLLDEHQCAVCHVRQDTIEPAVADAVVPVVVPRGRATILESGNADSLPTRLSPPLRGPPAL